MTTPSEPTTTTRELRPATTVPGLAIDDLQLAPDSRAVAALTGTDSTGTCSLLFLSTATGRELGAVTVSPDELPVLAAGWSVGASHNCRTGEVQIWRPLTGHLLGRLHPHDGRGVHALALTDDGKLAASIGDDGRVALWHPRDGAVIARLTTIGLLDLETCTLTFSPDGGVLAVRTDADTVELWRTAPAQFIAQLPETGDPVFSLDGRWAVSAGNGISIYDVPTGDPPAIVPGRGPVAFTPDGSLLVASAADGTTAVWRTETALPIGHLPGGSPRALSPDGRILAVSTPDGALTLVELATGRAVSRLTGHRGDVQALAVGAAGAVTVAACSDATLRVWAAPTP